MLASKRLMSIKLQGLLQWCFSTIILSPSSHKLLMRSTNRQNRLQHTQSPSIPSLAKVKTWTHGRMADCLSNLRNFLLESFGKDP